MQWFVPTKMVQGRTTGDTPSSRLCLAVSVRFMAPCAYFLDRAHLFCSAHSGGLRFSQLLLRILFKHSNILHIKLSMRSHGSNQHQQSLIKCSMTPLIAYIHCRLLIPTANINHSRNPFFSPKTHVYHLKQKRLEVATTPRKESIIRLMQYLK